MNRILVIILVFTFFSTHAQYKPEWVFGKLDSTCKGSAMNDVASNDEKLLWSKLTSIKSPQSGVEYGDYRFEEYDTLGNMLQSTMVMGKMAVIQTESDDLGNWYVLANVFDTLTFSDGSQFIPPIASNPCCIFRLNAGSLSLGWVRAVGNSNNHFSNCFTIKANALYLPVDTIKGTSLYMLDLATGVSSLKLIQRGQNFTSTIQVDDIGNIYMAGMCNNDTMNFNGYQLFPSSPFPNNRQYIVKYKSDGSYNWSYFCNDGVYSKRKLSLLPDNTLYYSGQVTSSFYLGNFFIHNYNEASAFFVSRIDTSGNFLWAKQAFDSIIGTSYIAFTKHAVTTKEGNLAILVESRGYHYWGYGVTTTSKYYQRYSAVVIYDKNGNALTAKQIKARMVTPVSIISSNNSIWITCVVRDSTQVLFDTIVVATPPYTNNGFYPVVAKLRLPSSTTTIEPIVTQHEFSLTPNPATTKMSINTSRHISKVTVKLIDNIGRVVGNYDISQRQEIDLSSFSKGLYFAHITDGNYQEVIKFVIE